MYQNKRNPRFEQNLKSKKQPRLAISYMPIESLTIRLSNIY